MTTHRSLIQFVFALFVGLVSIHALSAYSLGPVPIQWIAQAGFLAIMVFLAINSRIYVFPGASLFIAFFIWTFLITFFNSVAIDYARFMPPKATTPYSIYVSLRLFNMIVFFSALTVTYWLIRKNKQSQLITAIQWVGIGVSLYAIYAYLAQTYGWPELPRSRVGTSGGEQSTEFTYAFHRALGSFREPSHLSEWLLVPFLYSLIQVKPRKINWPPMLIGTTILLTGSLTGIFSLALGLLIASFFSFNFKISNFVKVFKLVMPAVIGLALFSFIAVGQNEESADLLAVVWERIEPILYEKGVSSTNRYYVYDYVAEKAFPLLGQGLGNANLLFGQHLKFDATASFLNMFLKFTYSSGLFGLLLIIGFICVPLIFSVENKKAHRDENHVFFLAGYFAWIVAFLVHAEELSLFFAVAFAFLVAPRSIKEEQDLMNQPALSPSKSPE